MRPALVVAVVAGLLTAACGSGGGTAPKAAYLRKAEAVCAGVNAQVRQAKKDVPTAVAAVPPYVHRLVDIAQQDVSALSALTPPPGDAAAIQRKLITPLTQQLADGQAYARKVDAAERSDPAALTALVFNPPTKTRVDVPWMKAYGFHQCVTAADTGAATR